MLVTGALGMLASEIIPMLKTEGAKVIATDLSRNDKADKLSILPLDICNKAEVLSLIQDVKPNWIINCAAYTAVDKAEEESELCMKVNIEGSAHLAQAADLVNATLVHVSSDYVFGAYSAEERNNIPFVETDIMKPCGVYGISKAEGDKEIIKRLPHNHLITRTSWLHGLNGPNFVDTMLRLGKERDSLKVVNDQIGSPTWARWLAATMLKLMKRDARGVFNTSSVGNISWYDFAKEIFARANINIELSTQTTEELARPAPRPPYSTLNVSKLEKFLKEPAPSWKDCVREHLNARGIH